MQKALDENCPIPYVLTEKAMREDFSGKTELEAECEVLWLELATTNQALEKCQAEAAALLDGMKRMGESLQWIAQQPCANGQQVACTERDICITEYCFPCYARAVLAELSKNISWR